MANSFTPLGRLKIKLDITDNSQDDKLNLYLAEAEDTVLDIIGRDVLPDRLVSVVTSLAEITYNRQGSEGEGLRGEGGISRSFINDLPADMQKRLKNYPRKVVAVSATYDKGPETD